MLPLQQSYVVVRAHEQREEAARNLQFKLEHVTVPTPETFRNFRQMQRQKPKIHVMYWHIIHSDSSFVSQKKISALQFPEGLCCEVPILAPKFKGESLEDEVQESWMRYCGTVESGWRKLR